MLEEYNDMLTISEICEILMIGRNRVYKLLNEGKIAGFRIGFVWKVPKQALIDFIVSSSSGRAS